MNEIYSIHITKDRTCNSSKIKLIGTCQWYVQKELLINPVKLDQNQTKKSQNIAGTNYIYRRSNVYDSNIFSIFLSGV